MRLFLLFVLNSKGYSVNDCSTFFSEVFFFKPSFQSKCFRPSQFFFSFFFRRRLVFRICDDVSDFDSPGSIGHDWREFVLNFPASPSALCDLTCVGVYGFPFEQSDLWGHHLLNTWNCLDWGVSAWFPCSLFELWLLSVVWALEPFSCNTMLLLYIKTYCFLAASVVFLCGMLYLQYSDY